MMEMDAEERRLFEDSPLYLVHPDMYRMIDTYTNWTYGEPRIAIIYVNSIKTELVLGIGTFINTGCMNI